MPTIVTLLLCAGGLAFASCARWIARLPGPFRGWRRIVRASVVVSTAAVAAALFGAGGTLFWFHHRSPPAPERRELFQGVHYAREVRRHPRAMVIHVVTIDLQADGVRFLVTPETPTGSRRLKGRTASDFVGEFHAQLAVNANYFFPFAVRSPLNFYPKRGDPVDACGFAASCGNVYGDSSWGDGVFYISADNRASFDRPRGPIYNAVNGNGRFIRDGVIHLPADDDAPAIYARSALALDRGARHLILVAIDGKQPGYSEGATLTELAEVVLSNGGVDATRLDEGGSVTLVTADPDGRPRQLNSPIHTRIPGRERPAANHLGVFANALRHP